MMAFEIIYAIYIALVITHFSPRIIRASETVENVKIKVLINASSSVCEKEFLSVTFDTYGIWKNFTGIDLRSTKFQNLAKSLLPCDVRCGGTAADFLYFQPTINRAKMRSKRKQFSQADLHKIEVKQTGYQNFIMTGEQWDNFATFLKEVGWSLIFDFNVFLRDNGVWNSSNAAVLLQYSSARSIEISSFELGNEQDLYQRAYNVNITPSELVADYKLLRALLDKYDMYKKSTLVGPGTTQHAVKSKNRSYMLGFIKAGGADVVDEISFHHYYLNGSAAILEDFYNVSVLDSLKTVLDRAINLTKLVPHPVRMRLSETSSTYGGGTPGMSNAYVAGFLWLDKLGIAALYGLSRVFRQSFIRSSYALVNVVTYNPNPDFYLSLLFKRLVEGPVFPVTLEPNLQLVRVYAHCARNDFFSYPPGALVLYYLNLGSKKVSLTLTQFPNENHELFFLTPGDNNGLQSRLVKLNGQVLLMPGNDIPQMLPHHHRGDIIVEARSFGFIVIPQAKVTVCSDFHGSKPSSASSFHIVGQSGTFSFHLVLFVIGFPYFIRRFVIPSTFKSVIQLNPVITTSFEHTKYVLNSKFAANDT